MSGAHPDLIVKPLMPDCDVSPAADLLSRFTPPPKLTLLALL